MFRPSLRKLSTLIFLGVLAVILFYVTQGSFRTVKDDQKVKAAELMKESMDILKSEAMKKGFEIDTANDPNATGLIGVNRRESRITTSYGVLSRRLTALNPNLSAVAVDLLRLIDVSEGDYVAVGLTGANPGANLAVYSAMQTLGLKPVIITSVGSAEFGANREDFTWLDMESILFNNNKINFKSDFASLGGNKDRGGGLGKNGRGLLEEAIKRNSLDPEAFKLRKFDTAEMIAKRFDAYNSKLPADKKFKAFINIGSGYANIGDLQNSSSLIEGVNEKIAELDFDNPGVMMRFAEWVPVIHINNVVKLAEKYSLPIDPEPIPEIGEGKVFESRQRNVIVAIISLLVILIAITVAIYFDRKDRHFTENIVDPDNDL